MYKTEQLLLAQPIQVIFFDIDGVFTNGSLIYSESGETLKQFNVLDGQGIKFLESVGVVPVVISGRAGKAVEARMKDLGISRVHLGVHKKIEIANLVLLELGFDWSQAAVIGDDWADLEMMVNCRFSCAPSNAHPEVLSRVNYVTEKRGGEGAVRQFCDLIITAKGKYQLLLNEFLGQGS